MNINVSELKELLSKCPDNMPVIIPVIDEDDSDHIMAFRYVRTIGILSSPGEDDAVCLSTSNSLDISEQIKKYHSDVTCDEVLILKDTENM